MKENTEQEKAIFARLLQDEEVVKEIVEDLRSLFELGGKELHRWLLGGNYCSHEIVRIKAVLMNERGRRRYGREIVKVLSPNDVGIWQEKLIPAEILRRVESYRIRN